MSKQWMRCSREIRSLTNELNQMRRAADSSMVRCRSDHPHEFIVFLDDPNVEITEQLQDGLHDWYTCRNDQCSVMSTRISSGVSQRRSGQRITGGSHHLKPSRASTEVHKTPRVAYHVSKTSMRDATISSPSLAQTCSKLAHKTNTSMTAEVAKPSKQTQALKQTVWNATINGVRRSHHHQPRIGRIRVPEMPCKDSSRSSEVANHQPNSCHCQDVTTEADTQKIQPGSSSDRGGRPQQSVGEADKSILPPSGIHQHVARDQPTQLR